jgi:hypothetical protein
MTTIVPRQREWTFRRIVAELPFIPATSNWFKLLCSLLAEPLMFVSFLCIIAETVLPGATTWPSILINGPKTVMSLAPEIILPGCFQQAQRAQCNGDVIKGNLLLCLCALFGLLTLITFKVKSVQPEESSLVSRTSSNRNNCLPRRRNGGVVLKPSSHQKRNQASPLAIWSNISSIFVPSSLSK